MRAGVCATALVAVLGFAAVAVAATPTRPAPVVTTPDAALQQLHEVIVHMEADDAVAADATIKRLIASPGFAQMQPLERYSGHMLHAAIAARNDDWPRAHKAMIEATAWPGAEPVAWEMRRYAAEMAEDKADVVRALTSVARLYPDQLDSYSHRYIASQAGLAEDLDERGELQFQFIDALFDADFDPRPLIEPSTLWTTLAQGLLERGNTDRALKVAEKVTWPESVARMRVDRRFDPIVQDRLDRFDVLKAAEAMLEARRRAMAEAPRQLALVNGYADALMDLGRAEQALALIDEALAKAAPADGGKAAYDDLEHLNWTLNSRATALGLLARDDEAVDALRRAARRPEGGRMNVSQAINLAQTLVQAGRPREALEAVSDITSRDASAYGWVASQSARACAHAELGDMAAAREVVADLRSRLADGESALQRALACMDDQESAAALLIQRLEDPKTRGAALMWVQSRPEQPGPTAVDLKHRAHRRALLSRPDVRAAIDKVGRIEELPIL